MGKFRNALDDSRAHVRSLWIVIALLVGIVLVLGIGLLRTPSHMTVHIPPDLRSGATIGGNRPNPPNVYAFASYIFKQLHRWAEDGSQDYSSQIFSLSAYLTPRYRSQLLTDLEQKAKRGELASRERGLQEIPGANYEERRVDIVSDDVWIVWLDMELSESVQGVPVKKKHIRYPLRVVRYEVDIEANPWGLALDGFDSAGPQSLKLIDGNYVVESQ